MSKSGALSQPRRRPSRQRRAASPRLSVSRLVCSADLTFRQSSYVCAPTSGPGPWLQALRAGRTGNSLRKRSRLGGGSWANRADASETRPTGVSPIAVSTMPTRTRPSLPIRESAVTALTTTPLSLSDRRNPKGPPPSSSATSNSMLVTAVSSSSEATACVDGLFLRFQDMAFIRRSTAAVTRFTG